MSLSDFLVIALISCLSGLPGGTTIHRNLYANISRSSQSARPLVAFSPASGCAVRSCTSSESFYRRLFAKCATTGNALEETTMIERENNNACGTYLITSPRFIPIVSILLNRWSNRVERSQSGKPDIFAFNLISRKLFPPQMHTYHVTRKIWNNISSSKYYESLIFIGVILQLTFSDNSFFRFIAIRLRYTEHFR